MRRFQVHFHNFEHTRNMLSASQRLLGLEFKTLRGGFVSVDYYGRQATARSFLYCGRGLCLARACTHARAAGRMAAHCVQCISSVCRDAVRDAVRHSVATVLPPWCLQVMLRSSHVGVNAAALEAVCTTLGTDQIIGYSPPLPPAPSTPPPPPPSHTHTSPPPRASAPLPSSRPPPEPIAAVVSRTADDCATLKRLRNNSVWAMVAL